ncbi:MAG: TetR/AcrR family transcriptional regulator [Betaproteobacteria bacterium]|jgi:AcrR family transcriptional regulator
MAKTPNPKTPTATAPGPRRQRLTPEVRADQILDAAARLIIEEGLTELSMERLGRAAGVSKALIYNYFPNRTDLLRALLEREMDVLRERQIEQIRQAEDFRDLVYRTTRTYVAQVKERGALVQRLWAEPAVSRTVAEKSQLERQQAMRYMAKQVTLTYGLPKAVALSAVDMQMALTEAAAQHRSGEMDVDLTTDICVTLLLGGLDGLAKNQAKAAGKRSAARKSR